MATGVSLRDLGRHRLKDVGPERLWQVEAPGLSVGPFPPPRSLEAHPNNLPSPPTEFVGREADLARLTELLDASQVVTVVGTGGIGKSRLAIEAARSLIDRFPDGVFYVDVSSVATADIAAVQLIDLLGFHESSDSALEVLRTRLRDRDLLILIDTADRVAGIQGLVASLTGSCPNVRLLVTSRTALRVTAEREFLIGPMPAEQGVRLFETRARIARPGWTPDSTSSSSVARLVSRLDGIPLAIELAAARVRVLTPGAILDRLERRLPALALAPSDLPDRQRTLDATIKWSQEQLEPTEQRLFARLGVFAGSVTLDAVERVCGETGQDILETLEGLVDRSLVSADMNAADPTFRLLGPIRDFASQSLRSSGEEAAVRERHATYYLELVRTFAEALEGADDIRALAALEQIEPEIRAALEWSLTADETGFAFEMTGRLGRYWWVRGRVREGVGWLERALSSSPDATPRALYWAGVLLDDARRPTDAQEKLDAALAQYREAGDEQEVARTLNSLGVVARSQGNLERAEALLTESLETKRRLGDRRGIASTLSNLGVVASDRGNLDRAAELFAQALTVDESIGSASAVVVSRSNLGSVLMQIGRTTEGLDQIRRALPGIAELGDPELVAEVMTSLSHVLLASGDKDGAAAAARLTLVGEELRRREEIPHREVEQQETEDLLRRESAILGPAVIAEIRAEASVTDLPAALRLARMAAGLDAS
jgi:predicted ATPase